MSDNLYDIRGLTPEAARQSILDVMTHLKMLEGQIQALAAEETTWRDRVKLAGERGRADLQTQAQAELDRVSAKKAGLEQEASGVRLGVSKMRETLNSPGFQAEAGHQYADNLLAELELNVGAPPDTLSPEMDKLGADAELERLKKELGGS